MLATARTFTKGALLHFENTAARAVKDGDIGGRLRLEMDPTIPVEFFDVPAGAVKDGDIGGRLQR
jgi:hypothetical protein